MLPNGRCFAKAHIADTAALLLTETVIAYADLMGAPKSDATPAHVADDVAGNDVAM